MWKMACVMQKAKANIFAKYIDSFSNNLLYSLYIIEFCCIFVYILDAK